MVKHKLVPVEPTLDMIDAGIDATTVDITEKTAAWIYEAMIAAAPAVQGEPVAWMHSDPGRVDVIHDKVRKLLKDSSDNAGYLHRPLDKSERYTIPLYAAPQPVEQTSINPNLASDAAKHLTDWLEMGLCECGGVHSCGYYEVERTRDALLGAVEQQECGCCGQTVRCDDDCDVVVLRMSEQQSAPDMTGLVEAMRQYRHNDGSGVVFGYDLETTQRVVAGLVGALEAVMEFGCDPKSNRGKWAQEKAESVLAAYHKGDES